MSNLGWLFYKDYFNGVDYFNLDSENNQNIIKAKIEQLLDISKQIAILEPIAIPNSLRFEATTTYPGLLLGSGYLHELPDVKSQAILGFYFDYTTGLPVIPGSSIKGVLRSAFKHPEYIKEILNRDVNVKELEEEIFGQDNGSNDTKKGKDIFFDAQIRAKGSSLLSDDYITPHKSPLKNPTPLRFIKVSPNVTFLFQFELQDGIVNKDEKIKLFKVILEDLGLGAKTNVGYGKFTNFKSVGKTKEEIEQEEAIKEAEKEKKLASLSPEERIFEEYNRDIASIINAMKANEIDSSLHKKLAIKLKEEMMKSPKNWEKAKQKALKRKEYIESILNN